ncbi:hypothetical protein GBZ48_18395 [Azospirillum melinis]|uniref:Uncharacterized protein n=1 Tax=Azospirillum melinis TaxID=328839 RepID=A0ABX2KKP1_9PROT|nr:hypothetical protein [Azospirillum melinis]MBP2309721.1 hypothetical protein [Azospirillum melinis]NUB01240.1 hypothetical protein [Azospirillum melinis]
MDNLLTMFGEARAMLRIEGDTYQPSPSTSEKYMRFYESRMSGRDIWPPQTRAAAVWRKAALRHGVVRRLRRASEAFEQALIAGDRQSAERLGEDVRHFLEVLYANPIARPGRRAAAVNPVLEMPVA